MEATYWLLLVVAAVYYHNGAFHPHHTQPHPTLKPTLLQQVKYKDAVNHNAVNSWYILWLISFLI